MRLTVCSAVVSVLLSVASVVRGRPRSARTGTLLSLVAIYLHLRLDLVVGCWPRWCSSIGFFVTSTLARRRLREKKSERHVDLPGQQVAVAQLGTQALLGQKAQPLCCVERDSVPPFAPPSRRRSRSG